MEWDEFTSFIVETGMHDTKTQQHAINQYHPLSYLDLSKHHAPITKLTYMPEVDQVRKTGITHPSQTLSRAHVIYDLLDCCLRRTQ